MNSYSLPQAKDNDAVRGTYIHLAVHDHGSDEFVAWAKLVSSCGSLVAVVQLIREIRGVVGMEHGWRSIFCGPYYAVG